MEYLKKHWIKIVVILGILFLVWYFLLRNTKSKVTITDVDWTKKTAKHKTTAGGSDFGALVTGLADNVNMCIPTKNGYEDCIGTKGNTLIFQVKKGGKVVAQTVVDFDSKTISDKLPAESSYSSSLLIPGDHSSFNPNIMIPGDK